MCTNECTLSHIGNIHVIAFRYLLLVFCFFFTSHFRHYIAILCTFSCAPFIQIDAYAVPANFLEIDVVNPMTTITAGKKRFTDYEVRMRVSYSYSFIGIV